MALMKLRATASVPLLLVTMATVPLSTVAKTADEMRGPAACQAWASAIYRAPASFPEEWRVWVMGLQSMALASPMNDDGSPLKNDPGYQQALREARAALAKEPASAKSPSYKQAYTTCMAYVELLRKTWQTQ